MRGNVDTRLRKLHEQDLDAIVLAGAGLTRLGLQDRITQWLPTSICLPAPGQGILAVQVREDDQDAVRVVRAIGSEDSRVCATGERAALEALGGGCQTPVGFLASVQGDQCTVEGVIVHPSGQPYFRDQVAGPRSEAADLGRRLGERLLAGGAADILE